MNKLKENVMVTYKNESLRHFKGRVLKRHIDESTKRMWIVEWEIEGVGKVQKPELEQSLMLAGKILE